MPVLTRIFTEDINRERILSILDTHLAGYTVTPTLGRYQGKDESSLCIEVLDAPPEQINQVAEEIKASNQQDSVLVVTEMEEEKFL